MGTGPGTRVGPYEIVGALGAGGMGEVYRARDTKLGREVALKVLPEAFAADTERTARFESEAKVLASLNHPNIASIYGFEDSAGVHALAMELVEGPTLAEMISGMGAGLKPGPTNAKAVPLDEALRTAKQIAEGLEYAHERGIVHRDLKPANVTITQDGLVKLLDFGLAKALAGDGPAASDPSTSPTRSHLATQAGMILGTAAYMAPEQAKGKAVDRRADIWAFGCVLYEMLTGRPAFGGETVTDILAAVVTREPDWTALRASIPAHVRILLQRCLRKDPKQRLRDIGDARVALDEMLSGAPRATVALVNPAAGTGDIWVYDLKRGSASRLTFSGNNDDPAWSPDGSHVLFSSSRSGPMGIYTKESDGLGTTQVVFESRGQPMWVDFVSRDGRYATCFSTAPTASVWVLPLFGERKPYPLVQGSSFAASRALISPNGRYVAYNSNETGKEEVYVQTFPQHSGKWQVSTASGSEPMWRNDGKELFYLAANDEVMALSINTDSPTFEAGVPQPLFLARLVDWVLRYRYAVSPDGQRFLMLVPAGEAHPSPITVVVNWPELLTSAER